MRSGGHTHRAQALQAELEAAGRTLAGRELELAAATRGAARQRGTFLQKQARLERWAQEQRALMTGLAEETKLREDELAELRQVCSYGCVPGRSEVLCDDDNKGR